MQQEAPSYCFKRVRVSVRIYLVFMHVVYMRVEKSEKTGQLLRQRPDIPVTSSHRQSDVCQLFCHVGGNAHFLHTQLPPKQWVRFWRSRGISCWWKSISFDEKDREKGITLLSTVQTKLYPSVRLNLYSDCLTGSFSKAVYH